jgi:hypothetical protein
VGTAAARVHDALGDALVIEVRDLLSQDEVLEQRRAARARSQRVLIVGDRGSLIRGQRPVGLGALLVGLASAAAARAECRGAPTARRRARYGRGGWGIVWLRHEFRLDGCSGRCPPAAAFVPFSLQLGVSATPEPARGADRAIPGASRPARAARLEVWRGSRNATGPRTAPPRRGQLAGGAAPGRASEASGTSLA